MSDAWLDRVVDRTCGDDLGGIVVSLSRTAGRLVFGDKVGLTLGLGVVLTLALFWRVGFFITDTYPIANAVANLADGRLAMQSRHFEYSLTLGTQPGLHEYEGRLYARNYGQVVFAVPFVWLLEAISVIAAPRLVLAGLWSGGVLVVGRLAASLLGRPRLRLAGTGLALLSFGGALVFATELPRDQLALVALQVSTLAAAGLAAVFCYRLGTAFHDRTVAVAAGAGLALATPVGFWSTIPKRHVVVTALLFVSVYAFARSRQLDGLRSDLALGSAYGMLGLVAWVHAFEGFFLVVTLFVVDIVTEPRKDLRRVALVTGMLFLSVLPMFLTNLLISGNPFQPPRLLPGVGPGDVELAPDSTPEPSTADSTGGASGGSNGTESAGETTTERADASTETAVPEGTDTSVDDPDGSSDRFGPLVGIVSLVKLMLGEIEFIWSYAAQTVSKGLSVAQNRKLVWDVFVRRGYSPYAGSLAVNDFELIDLSVLESTPLVGSLVALPAVAAAEIRRRGSAVEWQAPRRQTDLLVVADICVLTVVYLPNLPLFSQITVRYLLPAIALMGYCTVRIPAVRTAITEKTALLGQSYAVTVVVGTGAGAVVLGAIDPALGEAIQLHAFAGLAVAGVLALTVTGQSLSPERRSRWPVAVALGGTAGVTTVFLALAAFEYFQYAPLALDIAGELARQISVL